MSRASETLLAGNIELDEGLPECLVSMLSDFGRDVDMVHSGRLAGCDDADLWSAAQAVGRFPIAYDLDCSDLAAERAGHARRSLPTGEMVSFPIDGLSRTCLLQKTDRAGYRLAFGAQIAEYEKVHGDM